MWFDCYWYYCLVVLGRLFREIKFGFDNFRIGFVVLFGKDSLEIIFFCWEFFNKVSV